LQRPRQERRVGPCRLGLHPQSRLRCVGLRADALIVVPGGFCAERRPIVATQIESAETRLAALPPHEAVAMFWRLHDELTSDADRLADRIDEFSGLVEALLKATGADKAAAAGHLFYIDKAAENRGYLGELVARVKGGGDDA